MAQTARIDKSLKLVLPVDVSAGGTVYVHSTPLSYEVFRRYWKEISAGHLMAMQVAGGPQSAPKVGMLAIEDAAKRLGSWEGPEGVQNGLVAEIRRQTNVIAPRPTEQGGGWEPVPLADAIQTGLIDEGDVADIEGLVAFFMLASQMQSREALIATLSGLELLWHAQTTSLNCTEYTASLPTSTEGESSGGTPRPAGALSPAY